MERVRSAAGRRRRRRRDDGGEPGDENVGGAAGRGLEGTRGRGEVGRPGGARDSNVVRRIQGDAVYENQQEFLSVAAQLAREGRLSRFIYVSEKSS